MDLTSACIDSILYPKNKHGDNSAEAISSSQLDSHTVVEVFTLVVSALKTAFKPVLRRIEKYRSRPTLEVQGTEGVAHYDTVRGVIKPLTYRIDVKNTGEKSIRDLRARIQLKGERTVDGDDSLVIEGDGWGVWKRDKTTAIDLRGGDRETLLVFMVVQDYSRGPNFDPETDITLKLASNDGFDSPAKFRMKHSLPTATSSDWLDKRTVANVSWHTHIVTFNGDTDAGDPVKYEYEIHLDDVTTKTEGKMYFPTEKS